MLRRGTTTITPEEPVNPVSIPVNIPIRTIAAILIGVIVFTLKTNIIPENSDKRSRNDLSWVIHKFLMNRSGYLTLSTTTDFDGSVISRVLFSKTAPLNCEGLTSFGFWNVLCAVILSEVRI